jgi:four helix bundle protein
MQESGVQSTKVIRYFSDLIVWQKSFALGIKVFAATKDWPKEEKYALTDQVRRSSRSVGANIAEAWGKRRYQAHFVSKLSDADAELHETDHWLRFAQAHGSLSETQLLEITGLIDEVGRMLGKMMARPEPFLVNRDTLPPRSASSRIELRADL